MITFWKNRALNYALKSLTRCTTPDELPFVIVKQLFYNFTGNCQGKHCLGYFCPHIELMSLHIMLLILLLLFYFKIFILQIRKSLVTVAHWKRLTENAVTVNAAASKRQCNVLHLEILHILHFKSITPTPTYSLHYKSYTKHNLLQRT